MKERMGYPKEQMLLVIIDTFKGQDNDELRKLCISNNCEVVIVPHNLTNKSQPLDLSVNKAAKAFISEKYNTWMTNEISKQIKRGIAPPDRKGFSQSFSDKTLACQMDCRLASLFES